jgi:hypothetical protein
MNGDNLSLFGVIITFTDNYPSLHTQCKTCGHFKLLIHKQLSVYLPYYTYINIDIDIEKYVYI